MLRTIPVPYAEHLESIDPSDIIMRTQSYAITSPDDRGFCTVLRPFAKTRTQIAFAKASERGQAMIAAENYDLLAAPFNHSA